MNDYSTCFPELDPDSKLWIYVADRVLGDEVVRALHAKVASFAEMWSSHGRVVISDFKIVEAQIVLLGAFVEQGEISGCGIDKSLHLLEQFADESGFEWLSHLSVVFRNEKGSVVTVPRSEFRNLVKSGVVSESTPVFDTSISSLLELRKGHFERSAGTSWHGRVFEIPSSVTI